MMGPKATIKMTKQRILTCKPIKEIKQNKIKYMSIVFPEEGRKGQGNKEHMGLTENNGKMMNLNLVSYVNDHIK